MKSVLFNLTPAFFAESHCRRWLLDHLYPDGPRCHRCGRPIAEPQHTRFYSGGKFRCQLCGGWTRSSSGTILEGSSLSAPQIVLIKLLSEIGTPLPQIANAVGVHTETIRRWQAKLRAA